MSSLRLILGQYSSRVFELIKQSSGRLEKSLNYYLLRNNHRVGTTRGIEREIFQPR